MNKRASQIKPKEVVLVLLVASIVGMLMATNHYGIAAFISFSLANLGVLLPNTFTGGSKLKKRKRR